MHKNDAKPNAVHWNRENFTNGWFKYGNYRTRAFSQNTFFAVSASESTYPRVLERSRYAIWSNMTSLNSGLSLSLCKLQIGQRKEITKVPLNTLLTINEANTVCMCFSPVDYKILRRQKSPILTRSHFAMGHLSLRYLLPTALPNKVRVRSVLNWREFCDWVRRDAKAILGLHWNSSDKKSCFWNT